MTMRIWVMHGTFREGRRLIDEEQWHSVVIAAIVCEQNLRERGHYASGAP